jgi:ABC transporter substrate binding protein
VRFLPLHLVAKCYALGIANHGVLGGYMQRREFVTLIGGAAAAWPLSAHAQQPMPVVGLLNISTPSTEQPRIDAFIKRFSELGWINGRTVAIESRWAEGRAERFAEIAAEFVRLKVNVIVTAGAGPVSAVRQATQLIPIVFAIATDPVGTGLVAALAHPGGNITGLSYMGTDLAAKRLELLRGVVAGFSRLAIMPSRNSVAQMEAAVIKTGNDPMDKQDTGNEPQRKRRLLAARAHPLARQIGIEPQERCHEHDGENREINPVGEDRDRPGRGKQGQGCQNQEGDRLDVSGSGHFLGLI